MNNSFIYSILATALLVCACKNQATLQTQTEIYPDFRTLFEMESSSIANEECSDPPYGQCSFYADCLESSRYHCGPDGYPIGYGLKYCDKSQARLSEFSEQGQTWVLNTMKCLQDTLIPEATGEVGAVKTCEELNTKAFNSHAPCYLKNGLCALPPSDWVVIVDIVSFQTLFSSWEAVKETLEAAAGCSAFYASVVLNHLV